MNGDDDVICGATHVGRKRSVNQDHFLIAKLQNSLSVQQSSLPLQSLERTYIHPLGTLMLVADGMGGHAAGERASLMAIETIVEQLVNRSESIFPSRHVDDAAIIHQLQETIRRTHERLQNEGRRDTTLAGMGTTLTMAIIRWPHLYVAHAGDSRCYLIRRQEVKQLTTDHTMARRLVDSGGLKPADESNSKWSSVLWNVIGGTSESAVTADVKRIELEPGDCIMLCSDGLHRFLDPALIKQTLLQRPSPRAAADAFIQLALSGGGDDNITVIVATPDAPQGMASTEIYGADTKLRPTDYWENNAS